MSLEDITTELNSVSKEIPPWALLVVQSMRTVISELQCVKDLTLRVNELESFREVSQTVSDNLQAENHRLENKINKLETKCDDMEQRSRNHCLLIHGCPEYESEKTDDIALEVFNIQVGLPNITSSDISRSHRIGAKVARVNTRSNVQRPRPIIVRFTNWNTRVDVFKNKRNLKGTNASITESLTKRKLDLLKKAEGKFGRGKVLSYEGFIKTIVNDQYVTINSVDDL